MCASWSLCDQEQVNKLHELHFAYQLNGGDDITRLVGFHSACLFKRIQGMPAAVSVSLGPA